MSSKGPAQDRARRRIAVVCHSSVGGSGIAATELAYGLAHRGHEVHVITRGGLGRSLPECPNLQLHSVRSPEYPLFEHPPHTLAMACAIAEVCATHAIEVLHVHYAVPHATSAYLARQLLKERAPALVTTLHGTDVTRVGCDPAYRAVTRMCVEASDAITAPSHYLRDQTYSLLGIPHARAIDVIANGVDTERFVPAVARDERHFAALFDDDSPRATLLHVSNFRAVKRTRDLIDVFARLHAKLPARLLLIGEGPERAASEGRARELGLTRSVRFLGARADIYEHLQHAAAFVLTSETESFGLAALEALSCGVPVFGYEVGGLPTVITPDVGRLVPPFDGDALAGAIARVLAAPHERDQLARAARQRALDHFRLPPMLERFEHVFARVCSGKP
jgi:N-acetyl-alpha-D-glucosaminyl L-malate synthase BshA